MNTPKFLVIVKDEEADDGWDFVGSAAEHSEAANIAKEFLEARQFDIGTDKKIYIYKAIQVCSVKVTTEWTPVNGNS
jgi:hypothetical protein